MSLEIVKVVATLHHPGSKVSVDQTSGFWSRNIEDDDVLPPLTKENRKLYQKGGWPLLVPVISFEFKSISTDCWYDGEGGFEYELQCQSWEEILGDWREELTRETIALFARSDSLRCGHPVRDLWPSYSTVFEIVSWLERHQEDESVSFLTLWTYSQHATRDYTGEDDVWAEWDLLGVLDSDRLKDVARRLCGTNSGGGSR